MSTFDKLLPRDRWWHPRRHAVCVSCHHHGRLWCEARWLLLRLRLLDLWWWVVDATVADAESATHARTFRTRKTVPQPARWAADAALWERLYEEHNQCLGPVRHIGQKLPLDAIFEKIAATRGWRRVNRLWFGHRRHDRIVLYTWLSRQTMATWLAVYHMQRCSFERRGDDPVLKERFYGLVSCALLDRIDAATAGGARFVVQVFNADAAENRPYASFIYPGPRSAGSDKAD